jgi:Helix-turn-helix domain
MNCTIDSKALSNFAPIKRPRKALTVPNCIKCLHWTSPVLFTREVGITPSQYVLQTRMEAARRQLERTERGLKQVASSAGFSNVVPGTETEGRNDRGPVHDFGWERDD